MENISGPQRTFWLDETLGDYQEDRLSPQPTAETANLIGSRVAGDDAQHLPIIDLDIPHHYVPSSTPGHGHLFIDVPMTWEAAEEMLFQLVKAGVVESGYHEMSKRRSQMFARISPTKHLERHLDGTEPF